MNIHIEGYIRGRVQGVNFRDSTRTFAKSIGLDGLVRNEPDGSVYIEAEGNQDQLAALREWLEDGPSAADVEEIDLREGDLRHHEDFTVEG